MRTEEFQHELTATSALFGRAKGVEVTFSGKGAFTNGKMVNLPQMRLGKKLTQEDQQVMRGYVDHESGHLRHSDMDLLLRKYEAYASEGRRLAKTLHNALEDVWLERRVMREYPGARANLKATTRAVNERGYERLSGADMAEKVADPCYITPFALTWQGRLPYDEPSNEKLLDLLPDLVRRPLAGWIERVLECKNTAEVFELSEEIEALLKRERLERREESGEGPKKAVVKKGKPEEGDADGEPLDLDEFDEVEWDESEDDDGEADGAADGADDADADDDGGDGVAGGGGDDREGGDHGRRAAEDAASEDGSEDESEAASGAGEEEGEEPEVFEDFEVKDALTDVMAERGLTGGATREHYRPWSTAEDRFIMPDPDGDVYERLLAAGTAKHYDDLLKSMTGEVNTIRRMLERSLLSAQMRDWHFGVEDGRLDSRRFASALAGKTNVFKQHADRPEADTAVTFLIDLSGSMKHHGKSRLAMECAIALAEAIERTGIAYEVLGFSQPVFDVVPPTTEIRLSRWEWIGMPVFKPFERRLIQCKDTMSRIQASVRGNNCDGESLMMAWSRLRQRRETRKVMFVLSDGFPQCYTHISEEHLNAHLRGVVAHLESEGCQCVGVGIRSKAVRRFYGDAVVVQNLSNLAKDSLELLGRVLRGDRRDMTPGALIEGMRV